MQPLPSRVTVIVLPCSSVVDETDRELLLEPLEEEDALDDERTDPDPDETLTEVADREDLPCTAVAPEGLLDLISRPSGRIRIISQPEPETPT